jgi:hypothetical protein
MEPLVDLVDSFLVLLLQVGSATQHGVPGRFQELHEITFFLLPALGHLHAPSLLHGIVGSLDQMELVVNNLVFRIGDRRRHGTGKWSMEVHGHVLDRLTHRWVQLLEPQFQWAFAVAGQHVFDYPGSWVANDRCVASTSPTLLVDGQASRERKLSFRPGFCLALKATFYRKMSDPSKTIDTCPKQLRSTTTRTDLHGINATRFKQQRESRFRTSPRYRDLEYAVFFTTNTRNRALDHSGHLAGV